MSGCLYTYSVSIAFAVASLYICFHRTTGFYLFKDVFSGCVQVLAWSGMKYMQ